MNMREKIALAAQEYLLNFGAHFTLHELDGLGGAVLRAMREPTEGMRAAGWKVISAPRDDRRPVDEAYTAMIDAASQD